MARTYQLGDKPRLSMELRDVNDVLTNGTVSIAVTAPDGTTVSMGSVTNDGTGLYHVDFASTATQEGLYTYVWTSSGAVVGSRSGELYVGTTTSIVSLEDAKAHLNITADDDDDELDLFLDAATAWVEARVGPVVRRTFTETHRDTCGDTLVLNNLPVVSLTSIVGAEGWTYPVDVSAVYPDLTAGVVRLGTSGYTWGYPLTVTYVAGRTTVPPAVRLACLMYLKALWETQRGPAPEALFQGVNDEADAGNGLGLSVWRAEKLLEPYLLPPAVA